MQPNLVHEMALVISGVAASAFAIVRLSMAHQQKLLDRLLSSWTEGFTRQEVALARNEEAIRNLADSVHDFLVMWSRDSERESTENRGEK